MLPKDRMPEAEVTLRLAIALIEQGHAISTVTSAIDGAQVKTGTTVHFPIVEFLNELGWSGNGKSESWQCIYNHNNYKQAISIHSSPGEGDLVAQLKNGVTLRVESKKGPLVKNKSSKEYPLIREAIGQLMTIKTINKNDVLAVAVPHSDKFNSLATQWRERPLIKSTGINIITIDRDNKIRGLDSIGI
ncbi:hypothetical protein [Bathymodiolus thermophilus thioautotrophic gill symbiont]|uniref:Uncharacterized protein n=1 Tax=Bathymodiolus thermophilus thioautotrophic gill symbiont TaxID=2360 RepID=A0A1J5UGC4_9GAMM|nr:hypothetical protein [Bathymodiolus thermophilus thioautotrophic gill symbiont]OIR24973.1 hypothetical protein BGC33_05105 [Bathymodiolus thermophilus thioautotrophic gill symbiont]